MSSWAEKKLRAMAAAADQWDRRNPNHKVECLAACRDGEKMLCGGNAADDVAASEFILELVRNAPTMVVLSKAKDGDVAVRWSKDSLDAEGCKKILRRALERIESGGSGGGG